LPTLQAVRPISPHVGRRISSMKACEALQASLDALQQAASYAADGNSLGLLTRARADLQHVVAKHGDADVPTLQAVEPVAEEPTLEDLADSTNIETKDTTETKKPKKSPVT
jgi:hypothetical protein